MEGSGAILKLTFHTFFFFLKISLCPFIFLSFFLFYLFMAVLCLRFCARAFSSCGKRGPLFIAVRGPLTIAAPPVAGHRLQTRRLSSCGSRAQSLRGMWDLPRPGLEPVSPALAGGFSTTAPPGKPPFTPSDQGLPPTLESKNSQNCYSTLCASNHLTHKVKYRAIREMETNVKSAK